MYRLYLMLVDRPELARELPALPCSVLGALGVEDDEARGTTLAFPPPLESDHVARTADRTYTRGCAGSHP